MAGTANREPDIDELIFELDCLLGDLKGLGYDMPTMRKFQQETCTLERTAQIQRLQQQIARLQKLKERILQNSTSALGLASASSDDRSTKVLASTSSKDTIVEAQKYCSGTQPVLSDWHPLHQKIEAQKNWHPLHQKIEAQKYCSGTQPVLSDWHLLHQKIEAQKY
jgi:hypothetical protein